MSETIKITAQGGGAAGASGGTPCTNSGPVTTFDMRIIRPLSAGQTKCGWTDCCGGNPRACWQPGQEAERAAFENMCRNVESSWHVPTKDDAMQIDWTRARVVVGGLK